MTLRCNTRTIRLAYLGLRTMAIGGLGGALFWSVGLPAAWLSGAMVAVAVAALAGVRLHQPERLRNAFFVCIGITMGAGVRPEVVERVWEWPVTIAMLIATIVGVLMATYIFQRHVAGWDRETAFFAAVPGALGFVMALIPAYPQADPVRIALAQTVRLFVLIAVLPLFLSGNAPALPHPGADGVALGWAGLAGFGVCAAGFGWAAARLGVPAGWLTAPFFLSAGVNASGLFYVALPPVLDALALIGLGAWIGGRFADITISRLMRLLTVSLGAIVVGMSVALAMSGLAWWTLDKPFGQLLLAFAPGGLEAMALLAFLLDLDPAFVAAHQLIRYIGMLFLIPLLARRVLGRPKGPIAGGNRAR